MSAERLHELLLQSQSLNAGELITTQDFAFIDNMVEGLRSVTTSFTNFVSNAKDSLSGVYRGNSVNSTTALTFVPIDVNDSRIKKLFKLRPYTTFDAMLIRVPEGVIGDMHAYATCIHSLLGKLESVDVRLLDPLAQWGAGVLAKPERAMQLINNRIGQPVKEIEADISKLKKLYNGERSDELSHMPFMKAYPTSAKFIECGELVNSISNQCSAILGKQLAKKAEDTAMIMDELLKEHLRTGILKDGRKALLVSLSKITYETAKELEMISVLMFQAKVLNQAHAEAVEKLRKFK